MNVKLSQERIWFGRHSMRTDLLFRLEYKSKWLYLPNSFSSIVLWREWKRRGQTQSEESMMCYTDSVWPFRIIKLISHVTEAPQSIYPCLWAQRARGDAGRIWNALIALRLRVSEEANPINHSNFPQWFHFTFRFIKKKIEECTIWNQNITRDVVVYIIRQLLNLLKTVF